MLPLFHYIRKPKVLIVSLLQRYGGWIPDRIYLKWLYRLKMGKKLDLKNPKTWSEKLQWLKLYNRRAEYTMMVDKYAVKDYVAGIIGKEYIIQTIGVWDKIEDIEWGFLPDKFVLKTTYGGGSSGVVICKDKSAFDKNKAIVRLKKSMKQDIYRSLREWPYKNVPKRIIAEQYIEPSKHLNDLPDYKFFCFNGKPKYCQVISGRATKECVDFFDEEWNHLPFHEPRYLPFADEEPKRPSQFEKMWELAGRLADGKPFSRIDFFNVGESVYFGEITFFPTSGFGGFDPESYDELFGRMIDLSDQH